MLSPRRFILVVTILGLLGHNLTHVLNSPHRILLDTDVDTDDFIALLYLLKLNKTEFDLVVSLSTLLIQHPHFVLQLFFNFGFVMLCFLKQGITLSANSWTNAGHGVNHIYDILYMMGRDDITVGVGGEGGILEDGTILPDVGDYLPIIEQVLLHSLSF